MPNLNVNLSDELNRFVTSKIASGEYHDASEVIGEALRTLNREEKTAQAQVSALREAIDVGERSGVAEDGVFDRVREKIRSSNKH